MTTKEQLRKYLFGETLLEDIKAEGDYGIHIYPLGRFLAKCRRKNATETLKLAYELAGDIFRAKLNKAIKEKDYFPENYFFQAHVSYLNAGRQDIVEEMLGREMSYKILERLAESQYQRDREDALDDIKNPIGEYSVSGYNLMGGIGGFLGLCGILASAINGYSASHGEPNTGAETIATLGVIGGLTRGIQETMINHWVSKNRHIHS